MSFRGAAPSSGKTQIPPRSLGPNGPLISNLVPSWNQLTVVHRKQQFSGGGKLVVSPVSILRTWRPVRSTYARDAPSGEMEARGIGSSGGLFVTCRTFRSGVVDGAPIHPSLIAASVTPSDNSSTATASSHRPRQDAGIRRRSKSARSSPAVWYRTARSFSRALRTIRSSFTGIAEFRRRGGTGLLARIASTVFAGVSPSNGRVPVVT